MSEQPMITIVQKKIIKSLLYNHYDIMNIFFARIHTCGKQSEYWLYSGLEGALVYCIDTRVKSCRFLMFDLKSFEIVFDCELYKKFDKAYKKGTERFYYFEVENGFIGFEIPNMNEAEILLASIISFGDDYIKKKLKEYKPMKENEIKEKAKKMIGLLEKKFGQENIQPKTLKSEIVLKHGLLESMINTVELNDETGKIIVKGNGYKGIDSDLVKLKGLNLELQTELKVGDTEIFSKYISRNILRSFIKGLIIPKRKINRGGGVTIEKIPQFEENPEEEKKEENIPPKIEPKSNNLNVRSSQKIFPKEIKDQQKIQEQPKIEDHQKIEEHPKIEEQLPLPKKKPSPPKHEKKEEIRPPSPEKNVVVVQNNIKGVPPPPPPPPPPPAPPVIKTVKTNTSSKKSSGPIDLAAELAAKKKSLAKVETKDLSVPNLQKNDSSTSQTNNNMMAMILAQRNQMKKNPTIIQSSQPPKTSSKPSNPSSKPIAQPPKTNAPESKKPITSSVKPPTKQPTSQANINKIKTMAPNPSSGMKIGGGVGGSLAARISMLQNKMGPPKKAEKDEPKKPIVELASGSNVPRMNISKLMASLESNMGKNESISNEPIKVVEGSGAGVPPPPPPPPPPPSK